MSLGNPAEWVSLSHAEGSFSTKYLCKSPTMTSTYFHIHQVSERGKQSYPCMHALPHTHVHIYLPNDAFGDLHGFEITPDWWAAPVKTLTHLSRKHQQQFAKHCKLCRHCKGHKRETGLCPSLSNMDKGWPLKAHRNFDTEEIFTCSSPRAARHKTVYRRE